MFSQYFRNTNLHDNEVAICNCLLIISDVCTGHNNWAHVETPLHVTHGSDVTLKCKRRYINIGGNRAECRRGRFEEIGHPPQCLRAGIIMILTEICILNLRLP